MSINQIAKPYIAEMANDWRNTTFWGKIAKGAVAPSIPLACNLITKDSFFLYLSGFTALASITAAVLLDQYTYNHPDDPEPSSENQASSSLRM